MTENCDVLNRTYLLCICKTHQIPACLRRVDNFLLPLNESDFSGRDNENLFDEMEKIFHFSILIKINIFFRLN